MLPRTVLAVTAVTATGVGLAVPAAAAPPAPGIDGACGQLDGVLTELAEPGTVLECTGGRWQPYRGVYPSSDRWLSYGPELTLHGQGRRNPELRAGVWSGTPRAVDAECTAATRDVVAAGELGAPQIATADPGQIMSFTASPRLFSVALSGSCLWQRAG